MATLKGSLGRFQEEIRKTLILTICIFSIQAKSWKRRLLQQNTWWFLGHFGTKLKLAVLGLWLCSTMGDSIGIFGAVQLFVLQWNANLANIDPVLANQQTKLIHSAGSPRWSIALRLDSRPPLLVDVVIPVPIGGLPPIPTYNFIKPYWTSESYTTSYDTACIQ